MISVQKREDEEKEKCKRSNNNTIKKQQLARERKNRDHEEYTYPLIEESKMKLDKKREE